MQVPSLLAQIRIVEDRPTLETSNFAGPLAAPRQDIINHPLMYAESVRGDPDGVPTGFLNHLGFHRHPRCLERRTLVS